MAQRTARRPNRKKAQSKRNLKQCVTCAGFSALLFHMTDLPTSADIDLIKRIIPHRYPFLLVDKVEDIVPATSAVGIKNVTFNEPQFQGHFPETPIMPGVLIIEGIAQTASVLVGLTMDQVDKMAAEVDIAAMIDIKAS